MVTVSLLHQLSSALMRKELSISLGKFWIIVVIGRLGSVSVIGAMILISRIMLVWRVVPLSWITQRLTAHPQQGRMANVFKTPCRCPAPAIVPQRGRYTLPEAENRSYGLLESNLWLTL